MFLEKKQNHIQAVKTSINFQEAKTHGQPFHCVFGCTEGGGITLKTHKMRELFMSFPKFINFT